MTEFPRGWTLTQAPASGTGPSITVAGVPGAAHVLDAFYAKVTSSGAATLGPEAVTLSSSDGIYSSRPLGLLVLKAADLGVADEQSGDSLGFAATAGASLTIAFAAATNVSAFLRIQGHVI